MKPIKQKEATAIINSLVSGVVPKTGIQHITVGRSNEINAAITSLNEVKNGHSVFKFWIGEFGSGKSFMLHLLNTIALKQKFVVSTVDFTPETRLYATDRKAVALYSKIMNNLSIQTRPEGGALPILLEKWIENVIVDTAEKSGISLLDVRNEKYSNLIQNNIIKTIKNISDVGAFDFGSVIIKYYQGYINDNEDLSRNALKWLKGEYTTKTEARLDLGVREIINDQNYYDMLKNFCSLFVEIGYSGFMINLDEAINLYKISNTPSREKNYEKLLSIYNDCFQGKVSNLFINLAGTNEFLENQRRGLFSYEALKTRLISNRYETLEVRDYSQPVIKLLPLNHNEVFVLLKKLKDIFNFHYQTEIEFSDNEIQNFMEGLLNRPGAAEFLTPREVIRDFINIMNIVRQNPNIDRQTLLKSQEHISFGIDGLSLDNIEEI